MTEHEIEWWKTYRAALTGFIAHGGTYTNQDPRVAAREIADADHGPLAPDEPAPAPEPQPEPTPELPSTGQLGTYPPLDLGGNRGVLRYAPDGLGIHLGVNAHNHATTSEAIADAGGKWVRARMLWKHIDKADGTYDFQGPPDTQLDELVREYNARGIGVLFYLSLETHRGYPGLAGSKPYNDEGRANVARFAAAAARHFAGKRVMFELWNEPNIKNFWPVPDDNKTLDGVRAAARQYGTLAREVWLAMKRADPDCRIIGPSVTHRGGPEEGTVRGAHVYTEVLRDMGALQLFDLLSFHFYTHELGYPKAVLPAGNAPEESDIALFQRIVGPSAPPIINTETGWRTDGSEAMNRLQAAYNIRDFLWGLAHGIRMRMTFLHSQSSDMARYYMSPMCLMAHRVLSKQLAGFDYVHASEAPPHYVLEFASADGKRRLVAWKRDANAPSALQVARGARVVTMDGEESSIGASATLQLSIEPQYVHLP